MTHRAVCRFLLAFSLGLNGIHLSADSMARIVRLSDVQGDAQIDRHTGEGFESAILNLPITEGTRLDTGQTGRVEIEFEDGSTVRLTPHTLVQFTRLALRDSGSKNTEIDLTEGAAFFNVNPGKQDDFVVTLGHRSLSLDRSARFRVSMQSSEAVISVRHGEVQVLGASADPVIVAKNKTATFDLSNPEGYNLARGYADGPYEDWNDNLDQYHERNFNRSHTDSPYTYGFSDLNYYGSYINDPGVGSCWRPYFAGNSWDPFSDGNWVWYPSFGYTWVSAYPWGWAPYRYGNWNYLQAGGWCWQPGGWNAWAPIPRFVTVPVGWHPPVPPVNGHGRVPRLRGAPAEGGPARGFGDPSRRVVREGADGRILAPQPGEAGLGVPRGRVNLSRLPAPPLLTLPGLRDDGRGQRSSGASNSVSRGNSSAGRPAAAPASHSAPAPQRAVPAPRPTPTPRGGHGL